MGDACGGEDGGACEGLKRLKMSIRGASSECVLSRVLLVVRFGLANVVCHSSVGNLLDTNQDNTFPMLPLTTAAVRSQYLHLFFSIVHPRTCSQQIECALKMWHTGLYLALPPPTDDAEFSNPTWSSSAPQ